MSDKRVGHHRTQLSQSLRGPSRSDKKRQRLEGKMGQREVKHHTIGDVRVQKELKDRLAHMEQLKTGQFTEVNFNRLQVLHETDCKLGQQPSTADLVHRELNDQGYRMSLFSDTMQKSLSVRSTSKINTNELKHELRFQRRLKLVMKNHKDFRQKVGAIDFSKVDSKKVNSEKSGWDRFTEITGLRLFRKKETIDSNKESVGRLVRTLEKAGIGKDMLTEKTRAMLDNAYRKGVLLSKSELTRLEREVGDLKYIDQVVNSEWGDPVRKQALPKVPVGEKLSNEALMEVKAQLSHMGYPDAITSHKDPRTFQFYRFGRLETVTVQNAGQLQRLQRYLDECSNLSQDAAALRERDVQAILNKYQKVLAEAEQHGKMTPEKFSEFQKLMLSGVGVEREQALMPLVDGNIGYVSIEEEYPDLVVEKRASLPKAEDLPPPPEIAEGELPEALPTTDVKGTAPPPPISPEMEVDEIELAMLKDGIKSAGYPIVESPDPREINFVLLSGTVKSFKVKTPDDLKELQIFLDSLLDVSNRVASVKPDRVRPQEYSEDIVAKTLRGPEKPARKRTSDLERIQERKAQLEKEGERRGGIKKPEGQPPETGG